MASSASSFPTGGSGDEPTVQQRSASSGEAPPKIPAKDSGTGGKEGSGGGEEKTSAAEGLKVIGGLIALSAGLFALILVVVVALVVEPDTTGGSIATSAIGVIGSIVGAYFGVKVGSDGTKNAIKSTEGALEAHKEEALKAQVYALYTPVEQVDKVREALKELL